MNIRAKNKGSSLILVIILTFALSAVVAGLLQSMVFDKRLNRRIHLLGESRNAAEGAVEVAVAEIDRRAASYSSLTSTTMSDFSFPESLRTFLASGHVDSTSLAFKAGNLSPLPPDPITIDAVDPFNLPDIDKGKPVILRHAYIYGKASVIDPATGQKVDSYISNLVQVREQTWLNYAVFYNLDMEMHSGSTMDIVGPVHTNQTAYLTAGSGEYLRFYGSLTTPKKIRRAYKYGGISVTHTGSVLFPNKDDATSGELITMGTTEDSNKSGFKVFAENRWKGFVQDGSFAVPVFNPPGLLQYEPDDPATTSVNEKRNSAYAMVEPQLADVVDDDVSNHEYTGYKGDVVENQKFSALAGLTIRIKPASTWPAAPPTAASVIAGTDPGFEVLFYTGSTNAARPVNRANLPVRDSVTKKPVENIINLRHADPALLTKLLKAIVPVRYSETGSGSAGNRTLAGVDSDPVMANSQTFYGIYDRRQGYDYPDSVGNTNDGLKGAHHAVHIDLGAFNSFINAPSDQWTDQTDSSVKLYVPDAYYSGVVYVQIPLRPDSDTEVANRLSTDKIRPAVAPDTSTPGYAIVLRNAGTLPSLPTDLSKRDDGFTFATNAPVYIRGHYNADGSSSTGSSTTPDSSAELPALIVADAVTLLSSAYTDTDMSNSAKTPLNSAAFTEVATGIIAGIVPTQLNSSGNGTSNQWAGGVHNFVRFLENWTGDTYRYRGSIVALYENEVSQGPWYQGKFVYWYNFPARDVGYHVYFAGGKFPPGLPVMRTVRRISVADITEAQYNAGPPTPPAAAN